MSKIASLFCFPPPCSVIHLLKAKLMLSFCSCVREASAAGKSMLVISSLKNLESSDFIALVIKVVISELVVG